MVIVAVLYLLLVWLIFFHLKWVRLTWISGIITTLLGLVVVGVFAGFLNYLAPTARIAVLGRVAEVAPNVSGQIKTIPVTPNSLIKQGDVLFELDKTPFEFKARELRAQLAGAKQQVGQLDASVAAATANVKALNDQLAYANRRLEDYERLARTDSASQFRLQDQQQQVAATTSQSPSDKWS